MAQEITSEDARKILSQMLSPTAAAERAGVTTMTIYRWLNAPDGLPSVKTPASGIAIWAPDLESFLIRRKYTQSPAAALRLQLTEA